MKKFIIVIVTTIILSSIPIIASNRTLTKERQTEIFEAYLESIKCKKEFDAKMEAQLFLDLLAKRESSCNPQINRKNIYYGKYQFSMKALADIHYKDGITLFLKSESIQDNACIAYMSLNKYRLRNYISKYSNTVHKDTYITESGLLAAAHLLGAGNVRKWLDGDTTGRFRDGLGTHITEYINLFSNFDMSAIQSAKNSNIYEISL